MMRLTIQQPDPCCSALCGHCGRPAFPTAGLGLSDGETPLCPECGRRQAPALAALLDLARVAQRVGRIHRHTLVPSLGELLDLARAAENYSHTTPEVRRKAS
jgi:hypothetical protein